MQLLAHCLSRKFKTSLRNMILFCIKNLEPILKNFYLVVFLLHKYGTKLLWACNT